MTRTKEAAAQTDRRRRIALITNHGYAGVEIPVGGAPDTGGQNFYVNSLALALESLGCAVTIFARGGFPFFGSDRLREGIERLSAHVRYVYVPGGGNQFIRKEDIAIALDEQTAWLERFVEDEAEVAETAPWEYFDIVNTHYWDAAIIAVKLVERWQDHAALAFLRKAEGGGLSDCLGRFDGDELHRLGLSRELDLHLEDIAREERAPALSQASREALRRQLGRIDRHVWTPHSVGIIKERNYWNKDKATIRDLKFRERDSHEQVICARTPLFCSTSPEITRALVGYHGVAGDRVFDFPPCIDAGKFRPRTKEELAPVYAYLAERSGLPAEKLGAARIVFETSRMDRTKRKDLLLRSFARVAGERDDAYLFIGGGPSSHPVFQELETLRRSLPALQGRAWLLGFVPDEIVEPLFAAADLFVSASEMEGFGMSISQAAASGAAVISSDLIPFATRYAPEAAVVIKAGDTDGFARAIADLLANDSERRRRADALRAVAATLDWKATAKRFVDWFDRKRAE